MPTSISSRTPIVLRLDLEWPALTAGQRLLILDEAQAWPEIFNRLRGAIDDERRRNGRFLLLGSVAPDAARRESLAGRLSLMELTPFILPEVASSVTVADLWLRGGYPDGGVLGGDGFPQWQHDNLRCRLR